MMRDLLPFSVCGVVHLVRPLGRSVTDLETLRRGITEAEPASLFYHAVQPPLRMPASADLPPDDFSAWVSGVLQDFESAERLSFATQRATPGADALRDLLSGALDRPRAGRSVHADAAFSFLAADSVPVPMQDCHEPAELFEALGRADASVWFYHLIEQPWFRGGEVPVAGWLRGRNAARLATKLEQLSTAGLPIEAMRREAMRAWRRSQLGGRVARAARASEAERADEARDAVAKLARRIVRSGRETT